jgi:hypothetical protein
LFAGLVHSAVTLARGAESGVPPSLTLKFDATGFVEFVSPADCEVATAPSSDAAVDREAGPCLSASITEDNHHVINPRQNVAPEARKNGQTSELLRIFVHDISFRPFRRTKTVRALPPAPFSESDAI